ncbi:HNH endonuclease [Achromobacter anxifer]
MNLDSLRSLSPQHIAALNWFDERTGQDVSWPAPLGDMFLVNKAKGIHKPRGLDYALSVRQSLDGPYDDALHWAPDGSWYLRYHHEGGNPAYFTNRAMNSCRVAGVPVGVILQVKQKPNPLYRVLGLGLVADDNDNVFTIRQYGSLIERVERAVAIQLPVESFDATNVIDARRREMKAIAVRRGQPAFRRRLMEAYNGACAVSGCTTSAVLEAAHISPYRGSNTNQVNNGILLRADLHTLFDLGLLRIEPKTYVVHLAGALGNSEYVQFHGKRLSLPGDTNCWPDNRALCVRFGLATDFSDGES